MPDIAEGSMSRVFGERRPSLAELAQKQTEAAFLFSDMSRKIVEMLEDPTMDIDKWKEWLPVFRAVDRKCRELDPAMADALGSLAEDVRMIIGGKR